MDLVFGRPLGLKTQSFEEALHALVALPGEEERERVRRRRGQRRQRMDPHPLVMLVIGVALALFGMHYYCLLVGRQLGGLHGPLQETNATVTEGGGWYVPRVSDLLERDRELSQIASSWSVQMFVPEMTHSIRRARALPAWIGAGLLTAVAQYHGLGVVAGGVSMACLALTGSTPPDLWSSVTLFSAQAVQTPFAPSFHQHNTPSCYPFPQMSAPGPAPWQDAWWG